jgi:hypothetical protein
VFIAGPESTTPSPDLFVTVARPDWRIANFWAVARGGWRFMPGKTPARGGFPDAIPSGTTLAHLARTKEDFMSYRYVRREENTRIASRHGLVARAAMPALLLAACTADVVDDGEAVETATRALIGRDTYVYLTCNATGWELNDRTRLVQGSPPEMWTLSYDVTQPWMVTNRDQCAVVETYYDVRGDQLLLVPTGGSAWGQLRAPQAGDDSRFEVRYSTLGRHTATFNWSNGSFSITSPSNPAWKIQVLMYTDTDFTYTDSANVPRRVAATMSQDQRTRTEQVARNFVADQIPKLSSDAMRPTISFVVPSHPLSNLSLTATDCFYPSHASVLADIDPTADSVMVFWPPTGIDLYSGEPKGLFDCYGGLTEYAGAGQAHATIPVQYWYDQTYFDNTVKHEWGHSLLFYYSAVGASPSPAVDNHRPDAYVNCLTGQPYVQVEDPSVPNSRYSLESGFTHDYYSGITALSSNPGACLGIAPSVWATGGPIHKPATP